MDHNRVKGLGIVNKTEIDVFLELSCFFHDPADVGNLISGSSASAFSKTSLNIRNFVVHILLKPDLENFERYFTSVWDECNCAVVWAFFGIAFLFPPLFFASAPFTHLQWVFQCLKGCSAWCTFLLKIKVVFFFFPIGGKRDISNQYFLPLPQNDSTTLLALQHDRPNLGLFPVFSVSNCRGCREKAWRKFRIPQILWPSGFTLACQPANKGPSSQGYGFSNCHVWMWVGL